MRLGFCLSIRSKISRIIGLVVAGLALTVFAGPLFEYTGRAGEALETPATYIDTVFPDGVPPIGDDTALGTEDTP